MKKIIFRRIGGRIVPIKVKNVNSNVDKLVKTVKKMSRSAENHDIRNVGAMLMMQGDAFNKWGHKTKYADLLAKNVKKLRAMLK